MLIKTRISFALETSHPDCVRAYRSYMYGRSYGLGLWGRHRDSHNYGSRNNKPTLRHRRHNANNIHKAPRDRIYLLVLFKSIFFFCFSRPNSAGGYEEERPVFLDASHGILYRPHYMNGYRILRDLPLAFFSLEIHYMFFFCSTFDSARAY